MNFTQYTKTKGLVTIDLGEMLELIYSHFKDKTWRPVSCTWSLWHKEFYIKVKKEDL